MNLGVSVEERGKVLVECLKEMGVKVFIYYVFIDDLKDVNIVKRLEMIKEICKNIGLLFV